MMSQYFGVRPARRYIVEAERMHVRADPVAGERRGNHDALPERSIVIIESHDD